MFSSFSPRTRWNIYRILPFGIIWLVTGWIFLFVELAAMEEPGNVPDSAIKMNFTVFVFASVAVIVVGLIIGSIELFYLNNLFSRRRFVTKIFFKLLIYIVVLSIITMITFIIAAAIEMKTSIFTGEVWSRYQQFFVSVTHLSTGMQMTFSMLLCLSYKEISDHMGQSVLLNIFSGKYHHHLQEDRIFMFLDMKSSTAIAEKLGNSLYFEMLKEYYATISQPVLDFGGEIYQYVGDELVVSWLLDEGIRNNRCINCFFTMKSILRQRGSTFKSKYGVSPQFKAGMHHGMVTTGEIGVIKKEILFTGDVLNATARIQSLCNDYGAELLISETLNEKLALQNEYVVKPRDLAVLRGKTEKVKLFKIGSKDIPGEEQNDVH